MAVKQIQLSNIPRGELGEIMVGRYSPSLFVVQLTLYAVGNRPSEESKRLYNLLIPNADTSYNRFDSIPTSSSTRALSRRESSCI